MVFTNAASDILGLIFFVNSVGDKWRALEEEVGY